MTTQLYGNLAKVEFDAYCKWITPELKSAVDDKLPHDVVQIFMRYIMPSEEMHFEAVIRFRPRLFQFVWILNDMAHQEEMTSKQWRNHKRIYQSVVDQFNHNIGDAINIAHYCGDEKLYRVASVGEQFKKNAAQIRTVQWPICDPNLRITGSGGSAISETKYCYSDILEDRKTRMNLEE